MGKDSVSKSATSPQLPALLLNRPLQRQRLPPLDTCLTPCMTPGRSLEKPCSGIHKRRTRRTKTSASAKAICPPFEVEETAAPLTRSLRRCKTSASVCMRRMDGAAAAATPISTPCDSPPMASRMTSVTFMDTVITSPQSSAGRSDGAASHIEGQEGVAWIRGCRLGCGSYGTVYKAMQKETGRIFAVKEAPLGEDKPGGERARLDSELQICRSLRHPNIVSYLGHVFTDRCLDIFLEYVPGGSMASILSEFGALEDPSLRRATKGMLQGLSYLHHRNPPVVHRDIKAANLLVDLDFRVKIADFGCSKCSVATESFTTVGSIPWMAPEVMLLQEGHGRKADIWSVGCTVIELATAEKPWGKGAFDNMMYAVQHIALTEATPPIPEVLHSDGQDMVERCVRRSMQERPCTEELLQDPFLISLAAF